MALRKITFTVAIFERRTGQVVKTSAATVYASEVNPDSDETIARRAASEDRRGKYGQRLVSFHRECVLPRAWERPAVRALEHEPMTFLAEHEA